ncbi:hypothetical protein BJY04DRAFT_218881 [Aspergillus karnatakaensis]|uniref:uncharacterized protein n=1 Tax=Aspergillus karnatakaensis TaxID=1810916 RepID=UPI003CCDF71A
MLGVSIRRPLAKPRLSWYIKAGARDRPPQTQRGGCRRRQEECEGGVYTALDPHGISVIGARIPSVGVGGSIEILGGLRGFPLFWPVWACVKNFEVILSNDTIIDTNSEKNPDLFWALKGGGANFGVVTRFDLYSIPVHNIWYQVDSNATVALFVGLDTATLALKFSTPSEDQPACYAPFNHIPAIAYPVPAASGTVLALTQISGVAAESALPRMKRHDYRGVSSKINAQLYKEVYRVWREKALAVRADTGANQTFALQPVTAYMVQRGIERGGNCLELAVENATWWTTLIDWENEKNDEIIRGVSIATTEKWEELGRERGLHVGFVYMGDASRDQNPLLSYGEENLKRLREVSDKHDPGKVFQELQGGGFLLSRV